MLNEGKRVIFPMHLLVKVLLDTNEAQTNLKGVLSESGLLELGRSLKASLQQHFKLKCDFSLGLVRHLLRADSIAWAPNQYALRLANRMAQEVEQSVFLLGDTAAAEIQGNKAYLPADLDAFPAVGFYTLPFVLCFTAEEFQTSGLAENKAVYHDWRPDLSGLLKEGSGQVEAIGVTAYHKIFVALDHLNKNLLMDKIGEKVINKSTAFLSMDGAELLIAKGTLCVPFYTFEEFAEARPDIADEALGKAYLRWLDRTRLLMYGLEQRRLKYKVIAGFVDFRSLTLDTMEKIAHSALHLPDVIETQVLDSGWDSVQDLVLNIYQDETRFVCSVLSGFDKQGQLTYQTNFHITSPSGVAEMQYRVRELVNSCGFEASVKVSQIQFNGRNLVPHEAVSAEGSVPTQDSAPSALWGWPSTSNLTH